MKPRPDEILLVLALADEKRDITATDVMFDA